MFAAVNGSSLAEARLKILLFVAHSLSFFLKYRLEMLIRLIFQIDAIAHLLIIILYFFCKMHTAKLLFTIFISISATFHIFGMVFFAVFVPES